MTWRVFKHSRSRLCKHASRRESGMALIFVLIAISLLAVLAIEVQERTRVTQRTLVDRQQNARAYQMAKSAFRWAVFRLEMDTMVDTLPAIPGMGLGGKKDSENEFTWTFPLSYPMPLPPPKEGEPPQEMPDMDTGFFMHISDEQSRLNLNDVGRGGPSGQERWTATAKVLSFLLSSPRFQIHYRKRNQGVKDIPQAIDDWTDVDTVVDGGGDENSQYAISGETYPIKNGPLYTVSEIKHLKPINPSLYAELEPFVTVYPFDATLPKISNQINTPKSKININTAPVELIAALFSRRMTSNLDRLKCAQVFAQVRGSAPMMSVKKGATEPSFEQFLIDQCDAPVEPSEDDPPLVDKDIMEILDVRSDVFRIEATGQAGNNVEKKITAIVQRASKKPPKVLYWKVN